MKMTRAEVEEFLANLPDKPYCSYCGFRVQRSEWGRHINTLDHKERYAKGIEIPLRTPRIKKGV